MSEVNSKWSQLVRDGFFADYTYESKRRYAKSSQALTSGLDHGAAIIEVGCGSGRYHRLLRQLGYTNLVSVDLTVDHIRKAREINPSGLFVVASGENLPFKSRVFDSLVANAAIEHFANPSSGLAEFARVIRDHGRIVVTSDAYSWRILQVLRLYKSQMPIDRTLTYWGFKRKFKAAGLKIDRADAWGSTHYLRPLARRIKSLHKALRAAMADEHWSNRSTANYLSLQSKMLLLDENLFILSKTRDAMLEVSPQPTPTLNAQLSLEDVLASPCCHANFIWQLDDLRCTLCQKTYPLIDGIPVFV